MPGREFVIHEMTSLLLRKNQDADGGQQVRTVGHIFYYKFIRVIGDFIICKQFLQILGIVSGQRIGMDGSLLQRSF